MFILNSNQAFNPHFQLGGNKKKNKPGDLITMHKHTYMCVCINSFKSLCQVFSKIQGDNI